MGPFRCPRCGTLVNEVPAECRVCGTRLESPSPLPEAKPVASADKRSFSWIPTVICFLGMLPFALSSPGVARVVSAIAVMAGPIGWIVLADRRASKRGQSRFNVALFLLSLLVALLFALVMMVFHSGLPLPGHG